MNFTNEPDMGKTSMPPLTGYRILDLSLLLPGPLATQILRDLGATVTKLEPPIPGDTIELWPPLVGESSAIYLALNRGKKREMIDLKSAEGRSKFESLAIDADVVVEGFRPGVLDRLSVGYQRLSELNPRLIFCSITGFGQSGPYRHRAGHDIGYQALAGVLSLSQGEVPLGDTPVSFAPPPGDPGPGDTPVSISPLALTGDKPLSLEPAGPSPSFGRSPLDSPVSPGALPPGAPPAPVSLRALGASPGSVAAAQAVSPGTSPGTQAVSPGTARSSGATHSGDRFQHTHGEGTLSPRRCGRESEKLETARLPANPQLQVADTAAGAYAAAMLILAALIERQQTGRGRHLDISMSEQLLPLMTASYAAFSATQSNPMTNREVLSGGAPCYRIYRTLDGQCITLGALEPKFWRKLVEQIGEPELASAPFLGGPGSDELAAHLTQIFSSKTRQQWEEIFSSVDACFEPVLSMSEVSQHTHWISRKSFTTLQCPNGENLQVPKMPGSLAGFETSENQS